MSFYGHLNENHGAQDAAFVKGKDLFRVESKYQMGINNKETCLCCKKCTQPRYFIHCRFASKDRPRLTSMRKFTFLFSTHTHSPTKHSASRFPALWEVTHHFNSRNHSVVIVGKRENHARACFIQSCNFSLWHGLNIYCVKFLRWSRIAYSIPIGPYMGENYE